MELNKVFVINLKRVPERLCFFWGVCHAYNFPSEQIEVFDAFDGEKYSFIEDLKEEGRRIFSFWDFEGGDIYRNRYRFALLLSFLSVFKKITEMNDDEAAMVCLDDAYPAADWNYFYETTWHLSQLAEPFHIWQIWSYTWNGEPKPEGEIFENIGKGLRYGDNILLMSPKGAQVLIDAYARDFKYVAMEDMIYNIRQDVVGGYYSIDPPVSCIDLTRLGIPQSTMPDASTNIGSSCKEGDNRR